MRRTDRPYDRRLIDFLKENAAYRKYILRELEQRGPLLSREIEDHKPSAREAHRWWGARKMGLMLGVLNARGEVAVVGRRGKQRVWDLAERWYPESERLTWKQAAPIVEEQRFQSLGVRLEGGRLLAHPDAEARRRAKDPHHVPLAVRPAHSRPRPRAQALGLLLPPRDVRAEGEARVRLLRAADPEGRPSWSVASSPCTTARPGRCAVLGTWWEGKPVGVDRPLRASPAGWAPASNNLARMEFETRAIHAGQEPDPATGAIITPIYQTSTYVQEAVGENKGYDYARVGNPTRTALQVALASLENAKHGVAFSSGSARRRR